MCDRMEERVSERMIRKPVNAKVNVRRLYWIKITVNDTINQTVCKEQEKCNIKQSNA